MPINLPPLLHSITLPRFRHDVGSIPLPSPSFQTHSTDSLSVLQHPLPPFFCDGPNAKPADVDSCAVLAEGVMPQKR